ncbi:MAG: sulfatase family protein [Opitutales bacterium]
MIHHLKRLKYLGLAAISALAGALHAKQPNMLIVLVDDHAFETISVYDSYLKDYAQTPHIDRIAHEGMRFDNMTTATSICSPSRASILTGQYGHINGVRTNSHGIHDHAPHYPEELRKAGYQTWLVGKWHIESEPKGYEKFLIVNGQGKYTNPSFKGVDGDQVYEKYTHQLPGYSTDVYTDVALNWLDKRDKDRPFLLSLQFKAPHFPYESADRYKHLFKDEDIPEPPSLYEDIAASGSVLKQTMIKTDRHLSLGDGETYYDKAKKGKGGPKLNPHDPDDQKDRHRVSYQHLAKKYLRCIRGNDDNIRRLFEYLEKENLLDDTVIVYMSDQGYWLGQHGFFDKRLILESSMRTPFLIRYPELIKPGSINTDLCELVDIAPTLLDLAGAPIPEAMQGRSMVPVLKGETPDDWRDAQWYAYWSGPSHHGIRTERYTYFHVPNHSPELYDRQTDPEQLRNLANNPEYKTIIAQLEGKLKQTQQKVLMEDSGLPGNGKIKGGKKKKKKSH